ncbi:hypothetical protein FisN_15Lu028 [Fistulifera solaris]|uniref:Uncharacterized protein n=1 Tax=Fistulifera solaris TaxID=1519565 RepID=A0A1Z5KHF3_FISSO|nr:hypothetical protein FisN_15Lu028 [Fistulifera solaris]|eukprot:GAX25647.1 hypothetical protein FisN_15Lu028 [Fistulifera solaris]
MTRFVEVLQESKALLDELLKQPGSFSLHDSPYPYFLDYILQQAQAGDVPRKISLVLSERESVSWSSRRIRKHREALVCREHFKEIINGRMALGIDSDGEDNFYYAGAFDLIACVDYARKQDPPPHFVSDAIISYRGLGEICDSYKDRATQCHTRLSEINARALTEYQDRVRQLYIPDFMINLWDKKVTIEDIAKNLYNVVPKLQNMVNRVEMVKRGGRRDGKVLPLIINAKD